MRRKGKTTRLVNEAIEYFFKNSELILYTDYNVKSNFLDPDAKLHNLAQKYFINTLLKRLESEHYGQFKVIKSKDSSKIKIRSI